MGFLTWNVVVAAVMAGSKMLIGIVTVAQFVEYTWLQILAQIC